MVIQIYSQNYSSGSWNCTYLSYSGSFVSFYTFSKENLLGIIYLKNILHALALSWISNTVNVLISILLKGTLVAMGTTVPCEREWGLLWTPQATHSVWTVELYRVCEPIGSWIHPHRYILYWHDSFYKSVEWFVL